MPEAPGGLKYVMAKRMCMHCNDPACASACPVTALHKTPEGPVVYDADKCIGCRYCMWACPFGVPTAEWDSMAPKIRKCTMCHGRNQEAAPVERNGEKYGEAMTQSFAQAFGQPICTKACPPGCLKFGKRGDLLQEARARIKADPTRYHDGIYGEHEAGGTAVLYLAPVPFEKIGLPKLSAEALPDRSAVALGAVPPAVIGVGAALGGLYALGKRRARSRRRRGTTPTRPSRPSRRSSGPRATCCWASSWPSARPPSSPGSPSAWAAPPTSATPTPGASGSSSTWSGSRWPPAPSPPPA